MPDDRYLDGDPRADNDRFLFTDLSPFVALAHREYKAIMELIAAGRTQEALQCAEGGYVRAAMQLRKLETEPLPEVDINASDDASDERTRRYRR